jgi:hypothetical protein
VTAPNARLLREILGLCSSQSAAAEMALDIASQLAEDQLHRPLHLLQASILPSLLITPFTASCIGANDDPSRSVSFRPDKGLV